MTTHYINGKFTCQHTTGVQRTAAGLLVALDHQLAAQAPDRRDRWVLLCPPEGVPPALTCIEVRRIGEPGMSRMRWEQWLLPRAAADGLLLNLAGSAPALHRRQVCMLHDAAIFDRPQAYTFLFRTWYRMLFGHLARRARVLLTVSDFSRDRLCRHLGLAPERLQVVHNGADHLDAVVADESVFERHGLERGRYLLAVGSSNPNKNLPALEKAVRRLHAESSGLGLVLVGGVNSHVFARSEADQLGDPVVVRRTGPLSDAELKALYQHAMALVFPSLYEGFGLPPLEAMACGCPVLASSAASIPEVCGCAVGYFDPHDPGALEQALRQLVAEPARRASLRAAGTAHVDRFRWAESARKVLAHARSAAAPARPPVVPSISPSTVVQMHRPASARPTPAAFRPTGMASLHLPSGTFRVSAAPLSRPVRAVVAGPSRPSVELTA